MYSPFTLPFSILNPSLFISGKYAIYKNVTYNIKSEKELNTYALIDITKNQPWGNITVTFQWPNFYYIFDEEFFGDKLKLPQSLESDSSSNGTSINIW